MKTQKKKKKITKPFAIKCPVCNGRGEVKAHLYKDDSFDIDMTYVTCRACKGHGYIIHYGAEFTESQPNITTKVKKEKQEIPIWSTTATYIRDCNNCIYAAPTLNNNPTERFCLLKSRHFPACYFCSDWGNKIND